MFGIIQRRHEKYQTKTLHRSMASKPKIQNSVNSSKTKLSRVSSFAKDEDMDKILQEIDSRNKYSPSSKKDQKRESVADDGGISPDEELHELFEDVEKRNAELQELLLFVESTRDESKGQLSRITSAGTRGSTDSLVEKLMQELDDIGSEKNELKGTIKTPNGSNITRAGSKLEASASEEELDQMLAELLEL